jgi:hypothetical protein
MLLDSIDRKPFYTNFGTGSIESKNLLIDYNGIFARIALSQLVPLEKFLFMFESDLQTTVANIDWMIPERKAIHILVRHAWKELQQQFETATREIRKIDVSSYQARGLSGSQLELKIEEYKWRREPFLSNFDKLRPSKMTSDLLKRLLKALLTSADNILDTLASMLPPMQAIKEFKDTLVSIASD